MYSCAGKGFSLSLAESLFQLSNLSMPHFKLICRVFIALVSLMLPSMMALGQNGEHNLTRQLKLLHLQLSI
jgi:hypothetical protein